MYFTETIVYNGIGYSVTGVYTIIEDSFDHAFGTECYHYYEIEDLKILQAWDEDGESISFDNEDAKLLNDLTQILEEGSSFDEVDTLMRLSIEENYL